MRKFVGIAILFVALVASAQAVTHVYVKVVDSGLQSNTAPIVVVVTDHITKDGVTIYSHTGTYQFQDGYNPTETPAQFRARVVASEKAALDAYISAQKAADATESTNTDVSSSLTGITQ